jgi:hypothetical protein
MSTEMDFPQTRTAEDRAHRQRCRRLPPIQAGELSDLMATFLVTGHVTLCPTRYAAPTAQGLPFPRFAR